MSQLSTLDQLMQMIEATVEATVERVARGEVEAVVRQAVRDELERVAPGILERSMAGLLDAGEVGRRVGRSAKWVRQHATELGAVRAGNGPRPRLLFDPAGVDEYVRSRRGRHHEQEPRMSADVPRRTTRPEGLP